MRRGGTTGRWTTPPLRTTGCLTKPEIHRAALLGPLKCARTVSHTRVNRQISFARLRRTASWLSLRFAADMTPLWAVRNFQEGQCTAEQHLHRFKQHETRDHGNGRFDD